MYLANLKMNEPHGVENIFTNIEQKDRESKGTLTENSGTI